MKRNIFLFLIVLMNFSKASAQEGWITTYITKEGERCSKAKAAYVRKVLMDGDVYKVDEYDLNGNIYMRAKCASLDPIVFEGLCTYYYENGQIRAETFFKNNTSTSWGYWTEKGESVSSKYSGKFSKDTTVFKYNPLDEKFKAASYPGGNEALGALIREKIKYPQQISWRHISDKMFVSFLIDTTGKVAAMDYNQKMGPDFESQVADLFQAMPLFIPATQEDRKVKTMQLLPINFLIRNE